MRLNVTSSEVNRGQDGRGICALDDSLDPLAVHDVRALLRSLNEEGCTLLLASHSISDVERLCHRVGILIDGRLARVVEQSEWAGEPGRLEAIFVDTVRPKAAA